ncbi:hypothetical protein EJ110_NYTH22022 [Nymphaea thermarum]|nr:hypothetical protein EJ110_NYTH22022 [Nymphaea thermarum]
MAMRRASKPYIAMISLQFGYAGMNIIHKGVSEQVNESLCASGVPPCHCDRGHGSFRRSSLKVRDSSLAHQADRSLHVEATDRTLNLLPDVYTRRTGMF